MKIKFWQLTRKVRAVLRGPSQSNFENPFKIVNDNFNKHKLAVKFFYVVQFIVFINLLTQMNLWNFEKPVSVVPFLTPFIWIGLENIYGIFITLGFISLLALFLDTSLRWARIGYFLSIVFVFAVYYSFGSLHFCANMREHFLSTISVCRKGYVITKTLIEKINHFNCYVLRFAH